MCDCCTKENVYSLGDVKWCADCGVCRIANCTSKVYARLTWKSSDGNLFIDMCQQHLTEEYQKKRNIIGWELYQV